MSWEGVDGTCLWRVGSACSASAAQDMMREKLGLAGTIMFTMKVKGALLFLRRTTDTPRISESCDDSLQGTICDPDLKTCQQAFWCMRSADQDCEQQQKASGNSHQAVGATIESTQCLMS